MSTPYVPPEVRFSRFVSPEPNTGCHLWTGTMMTNGYPVFWLDRKRVLAHRFALQSATGSTGEGLCACHRCDNPACVNADHMFWGTDQDNMADRDRKNRVQHGDGHYNARLTSEKIAEIRVRVAAGEEQKAIAREIGVRPSTICDVLKGRTWRRACVQA